VEALATLGSVAPQREIGLDHWIGSHPTMEALGTRGLEEGAAGVVGE
jgi:hypothetical protein